MPSTYLSLHHHLVFSTKDRLRTIDEPWRERLHEYLGGTVAGLGGFPQGVGGVADHVHLLVGLKATHCLSDFMRELKKASSLWVHEKIGLASFAWREGYSAFTVSATARDSVQGYIAHQVEHHRVKSLSIADPCEKSQGVWGTGPPRNRPTSSNLARHPSPFFSATYQSSLNSASDATGKQDATR